MILTGFSGNARAASLNFQILQGIAPWIFFLVFSNIRKALGIISVFNIMLVNDCSNGPELGNAGLYFGLQDNVLYRGDGNGPKNAHYDQDRYYLDQGEP